MKEKGRMRTLSLIIFSIGVLLGSTLVGITVWGDLEATLFNPGIQEEARLGQLHCPVILTTAQETGIISARIRNPLDHTTSFFARARISEGYLTLMREETTQLSLAPGESSRLAWQISAEDAAFNRIIFFRVTVRGGYPLPTRQGTCGVVLLDLPVLTGGQVYALGVILSLVCTIGGFAAWIAKHPQRMDLEVQIVRIMGLLTVTLIGGIILSFLGWWVIGLLALVVMLLSIGAFISYLNQ